MPSYTECRGIIDVDRHVIELADILANVATATGPTSWADLRSC